MATKKVIVKTPAYGENPDFDKAWQEYSKNAKGKFMGRGQYYEYWLKQQHDNGTAPAVMSKELKIEAPAPEPDDTETEPEPTDTGDQVPEKRSNLKWWIIGGMGGALLIAIVVIIILATRKK